MLLLYCFDSIMPGPKAKGLYSQGNTIVAQFQKENAKMNLVHHMTFLSRSAP